jgi:predicted DNA-binding protein (MmcQ/YjbR family)
MDLESVREYCLSLPHATEGVQWDNDLLFRIGGKMFAVMGLDRTPTNLAFKCTPEKFDELIEREGIIPAPYMARNKWVMLEQLDALGARETRELLKISYDLVLAKLPKKTREAINSGQS